MPILRAALAPMAALALVLLPAASARTWTDDQDEAKELAEKIQKALKKAEEAQRKAALKAEKRAREEKEDVTEAQQEAREKADKDRRTAEHKDAEGRHDTAKLEEQALDTLEDAVEDYVKKVQKKAASQVGPRPEQATPEQILTHQRALADAIRALRPGAKQGDLIVPEAQPIVKRLIADQLAGPANAPARKEAIAGNPSLDPDHDDRMQVRLAVNAPYPAAAALSTVPPSVVLTLPLLRKEVEYHFVGRDLVLLDVEANLILDYLRDAAPPLAPATPASRPVKR
jgi:hypothetical protein